MTESNPTDFVVVAENILQPSVITLVGAGLGSCEWYEAHSHSSHYISDNLPEVLKRELGKGATEALGLLPSAVKWCSGYCRLR
eukprot:7489527-Pyramimonas_sp.AAC.1